MYAEIMTVDEVARYLRMDSQTVYRRAEAGLLPAIRIGRLLRFKRDLLDEWLRLMAMDWDRKRQKSLYTWAERFTKQRSFREADVLKAIRRRRYVHRSAA